MANSIQSIALDKLIAHPDNPNRQSRANFAKLVRNIERTGRYEPVIVRPCHKNGRQAHPEKVGFFQIINGCHRCRALAKLGYKQVDAIVWDIDDEQTDILLATLNRLGGSDELAKKLALLSRLNGRMASAKLAKLLPQTAKQIERLTSIERPSTLTKMNANCFANPLVFFVNDMQKQIIENALSLVEEPKSKMTKAAKRTAALVHISGYFLNHSKLRSLREERSKD